MDGEAKKTIFSGYFERNMDDKFRLSIPAKLRSQLEQAQSPEEMVYIFYSVEYKVIRIYTQDSWVEFIQPKIDAVEDPDMRLLAMRAVYKFTETQTLDPSGRITVNKKLAAMLEIGKNVSICGMGRGIEIAAVSQADDSAEITEAEKRFLRELMI